MSALSLISAIAEGGEDGATTCVKIVPPQTNSIPSFSVGKGAYCFVIDVSGRCVPRVEKKNRTRDGHPSHSDVDHIHRFLMPRVAA